MTQRSGSVDASRPVPGANEAAENVRIVRLEPGQRLQATVVEADSGGLVTIGVLGARIAAFSRLPLEVGQTYDFTVASVAPRVVLSAARALDSVPQLEVANAAGRLGPHPQALLAAIRDSVDVLSEPSGRSVPERATVALRELGAAVEALSRGGIDEASLRVLHSRLGHDLEARVLRLAQHPNAERVAPTLIDSLKAQALDFLEVASDLERDARVVDTLRELVRQLNSGEADNARRADAGAATHVPLPLDREFLDARMFLLQPDRDRIESESDGDRPFSIVLLLDLTRLGAIRVNLEVRGQQVSLIDFQTVDESSANAIRASSDRLVQSLEESGLEPGRVSVRRAAGCELPVSDLCAPPTPGDPTRLVDVHV